MTISKGIKENASVSQHKQFDAQASLLLRLRDLERWLKQGDACPQSSDPIRPCHAPLTQQRYSVSLKHVVTTTYQQDPFETASSHRLGENDSKWEKAVI